MNGPRTTLRRRAAWISVFAYGQMRKRAEAAEARIAELERERDEARAVRGRMFADRNRAEAAEARVAALTEALREIARSAQAAINNVPGPTVGAVLQIKHRALAAAGEPEAATP